MRDKVTTPILKMCLFNFSSKRQKKLGEGERREEVTVKNACREVNSCVL